MGKYYKIFLQNVFFAMMELFIPSMYLSSRSCSTSPTKGLDSNSSSPSLNSDPRSKTMLSELNLDSPHGTSNANENNTSNSNNSSLSSEETKADVPPQRIDKKELQKRIQCLHSNIYRYEEKFEGEIKMILGQNMQALHQKLGDTEYDHLTDHKLFKSFQTFFLESDVIKDAGALPLVMLIHSNDIATSSKKIHQYLIDDQQLNFMFVRGYLSIILCGKDLKLTTHTNPVIPMRIPI